jgi:hypothetical protein
MPAAATDAPNAPAVSRKTAKAQAMGNTRRDTVGSYFVRMSLFRPVRRSR